MATRSLRSGKSTTNQTKAAIEAPELPGPSNATLVPFADDPVRGPPLVPQQSDIECLTLNKTLSTKLIDYVLRNAIRKDIPDDVLIGSSTSLSYFEVMNTKKVNSKNVTDAKKAKELRRKYQVYSLRQYNFYAANCSENHFLVINVVFDINSSDVFHKVVVYDSMRRSSRKNDAPHKQSVPAHFLCEFQKFLSQFTFFNTPNNEKLLADPTFILKKAKYCPCPQQQNGVDCGLFAVAVILHLLDGHNNLEGLFTQSHIQSLRHDLYRHLTTTPHRNPPSQYFLSFFPAISKEGDKQLKQPENVVFDVHSETNSIKNSESDSAYDPTSDTDDIDSNPEVLNDAVLGTTDNDQNDLEVEEVDDLFMHIFVEKPKIYYSTQELDPDIDKYESLSGNRLIIHKSEQFARTYKCVTHVGCCFRAKFGKVHQEDQIILKPNLTKAAHIGKRIVRLPNERKPKRRIKGRLDAAIDQVAVLKAGKPVPKDVMKAAANLQGLTVTYKQSHRALQQVTKRKWELDKGSFQLIIPYLSKFEEMNPDSTVDYKLEIEADGNYLNRLFVCPGIMKTTLRHVRPVISLDAAHLKSEWMGTLYVASVKTTCDEIYPVAIGIAKDNESEATWTWFLELLHSAVELLVMTHPRASVAKKYFTFMSDRQKGLIQALNKVFPDNHSCHCSIHIARNTEKLAGKKVARFVHALSTTFSKRVSTDLLQKIEDLSPRAKEYLEEIPASQWRNTAWLDDPCLPTRFGIVSSNMSESANSMFEEARTGSWLNSLDKILGKMFARISNLRKKLNGKSGIVDGVLAELRKNWEACAGYEVHQQNGEGTQFTIVRQPENAVGRETRFTIDLQYKTCECGLWQHYLYPCIDVLAYYRIHEVMPMHRVFAAEVDKLYTYENEQEMLNLNIHPVCMEAIGADGSTLPPKLSTKRQAGRPKTKRFRKRSRWAHEPERSNIVCSGCKRRGHNIRTCLARADMERQRENASARAVASGNDTEAAVISQNTNELDLS